MRTLRSRFVAAALPKAAALGIVPLLLGGCPSEREAATHGPNVATRHAPKATPATAPLPSAAPEPISYPALAFDPPARVRLPARLAPGERVPLLVVLHGFGVPSTLMVAKAGLDAVADSKRFAYLAPEGMRDSLGRPFWNAGASCCDLENRAPDDVERLRQLIDDSAQQPGIDPERVFVIGYSNGGFMAQRLACDAGERIAGVISVAGAAPSPDHPCSPKTRLSVLEIHGDADPIVHYQGGTVFDRSDVQPHLSAIETVKYWADRLACTGTLHQATELDLETQLPGRETRVQRYDDCRGAVELWTVRGGGHYVALQPPALEAMWTFIQAHPKQGTDR